MLTTGSFAPPSVDSAILRRRTLAVGAAWALPAIALAAAAPALAASGEPPDLVMVTTSFSGVEGGVYYDLDLRDSLSTNGLVKSVTFRLLNGGLPVVGTAMTVTGDETKDGEGNYMIGFSPPTQTTGFGESPIKRIATLTTNALGEITVKVSTATYGSVDCGSIPRSGTFTVSAAGITVTFTYLVKDGVALVTCP